MPRVCFHARTVRENLMLYGMNIRENLMLYGVNIRENFMLYGMKTYTCTIIVFYVPAWIETELGITAKPFNPTREDRYVLVLPPSDRYDD